MRIITECRSCESKKLTQILDLGEQYVSDFRKDESKPNKYPIEALICGECLLVQLKHTTPSAEMYHDNYGFKSGVSDSIKDDLKEIVELGLTYNSKPNQWLDIASNDGYLLSCVPHWTRRVGVDPVKFLCDEAEKHADLIINDYFRADLLTSKYNIITSISCFYDMDDPNNFVGDVASVLEKNGVWIVQQNYLLPTMELNAVDNFCHEHLEYYTLKSLEPLLERHGLQVINLSTSMVNGGSLRTVVAHRGVYPIQDSVERQRTVEMDAKLDRISTYTDFGVRVRVKLEVLEKYIKSLCNDGKSVYILAASTRGATIWQSAHIDSEIIHYAVERNPKKVGKYFSAVGCKIISEEEARKLKPDYMIVGPWFFSDEITKREADYLETGGHLIIPLPELKVI